MDITYKVVKLESNTPFGKYPANLVKRATRETVLHLDGESTEVPTVNRQVDSIIGDLIARATPGDGAGLVRQALLVERLPACRATIAVRGRTGLELAVFGLNSLVYAPGCPTRLGASASKLFAGIKARFGGKAGS